MIIKAPLLAEDFDPEKAKYPYLVTPKIDGIRFIMINGVAVSRKLKPIRNEYLQKLLQKHLPNGVDGELTSGDTFQQTTSGIMTIKGEPEFKVWIFDYVNPEYTYILPYYLRMFELTDLPITNELNYEKLIGTNVKNHSELISVDKIYKDSGYEGTMLRDPNGTYKFGRSTVKENILLKMKSFIDDEGLLVDVLEKMSNQNELGTDELGHAKRSSAKNGMVPMNTAGSLMVQGSYGLLKVGSGLDDDMRDYIWNNKESLIGTKFVKYKFFPYGVKNLPRHPVFIGFRDPDDM